MTASVSLGWRGRGGVEDWYAGDGVQILLKESDRKPVRAEYPDLPKWYARQDTAPTPASGYCESVCRLYVDRGFHNPYVGELYWMSVRFYAQMGRVAGCRYDTSTGVNVTVEDGIEILQLVAIRLDDLVTSSTSAVVNVGYNALVRFTNQAIRTTLNTSFRWLGDFAGAGVHYLPDWGDLAAVLSPVFGFRALPASRVAIKAVPSRSELHGWTIV